MTKDETKKRVSLYFNLENADEKIMYEYLDKRNKSQYIKNLILNDIKGNNIVYRQPAATELVVDKLEDADLNLNEMDFGD